MCSHWLWFRRIEFPRLCLFAAQFELQPPAMRRVPRFTPDFERSNLCETGSEMHNQIYVAHFLAIAQQGHQRSVTMDIRFVQRRHLAVRIVSCARAVERERHWAVREHREFAV